ncbi:MAG: efflux RND transporter permease subunit [Gammaproteobacteria bacterium]
MNLAELSLRNRVTTLVLTAVLFVGGIQTFQQLSRLEDPEFTIKDALVFTPYSGASPVEVEEEVTEKIERAVQQLSQIKEVESRSERGLSTVTVTIKDQFGRDALPQVWDELRRKVNDVQSQLPPKAGPSVVNDDFGDVFGVFVALYGPGYTYAELKEVAQMLRREYLLVQDVAKVSFWGDRQEAIYIETDRDRAAQLGVTPYSLQRSILDKNLVVDAGRVRVGERFVDIDPTGTFPTAESISDMLIRGESDAQFYLRDVADVSRGYVDPPTKILRYGGQPAIGIGISTTSGGNVVTMGAALEARTQELLNELPLGLEFGIISLQSDAVTTAISGFINSLMQAVAIVIAVLLVFMGLRSGIIIGFVLALTIAGTFIFMQPWGVALERISLGALIIALGMLVDNAIVVVDGILVRVQGGQKADEAAIEVVDQTAMPLLGATAVAIMAFGAIGLSDDATGEFCRSLFQVVLISLSLSWVTAMTVTPVICVMFLKPPKAKNTEVEDAGSGGFYGKYRGVLEAAIRHRGITIALVVGIFAVSMWGFRYIDQSFFPDSTRPQFMLDFWLPEGTHIDETLDQVKQVEDYLNEQAGVTNVTSLVGAGALRFILTYAPEKASSAYAQFLVDVEDYRMVPGLINRAEQDIPEQLIESDVFGRMFILGPGEGGKIQARFSGPDAQVLRELEAATVRILREDGGAKGIRSDWRNRVPYLQPVLTDLESNQAGVERPDVATAMRSGFEGESIAVFRDGDELLPIIVRAEKLERGEVSTMNDLLIWSPTAQQSIPLRQVVSDFDTNLRDPIVQRLNRSPTITIHADPASGVANTVLNRVRPQIEALELPTGYSLEWWGEYRDTNRGRAGIAASLPLFLLAMVLIVIALFNSLRQPLVIWLTVPLALIGVTAGLLLTGQPFGFMATLGFLSLIGMLIKNAIVLIDEIEVQKASGKQIYDAIVSSGVSRLRPVSMAALTTVMGMLPLLLDAFFISMAVTIIFGLLFATVLTMIVVPVLYAVFFRVPSPSRTVP